MIARRRLKASALLLFTILGCVFSRLLPVSPQQATPFDPATTPVILERPTSTSRSIIILVDDFRLQPYQGEAVYFFNRLEGDRGAINNSLLDWGDGHVSMTISPGNTWGGVWISLNHPLREGLSINFSAVLPAQIPPAYQSQITGLEVNIAGGSPDRRFKLELKNRDDLHWKMETGLAGGAQTLSSDLPALGNINQLIWVLDQAAPADFVVIERVSFTATTAITDTALAAFVWSYGMLLDNWNPATGLVRDKAKDASGEFDAIQATGSLAAASAQAAQLGVISHGEAVEIVNKISNVLLVVLPRFHGLWPHWVETSPAGEISIVEGTEWSSVDTVIAALGLLTAQSALGLDTAGAEQALQSIDWQDLLLPGGISHGYTYAGGRIPYAWDVFGGESWLVALAYAGSGGQVTPLAYAAPPTANGSGFIDELAWLFVPPPAGRDVWGADWAAYRPAAAQAQAQYFSTYHPDSCFARLGLFGLSAAETPAPSSVTKENIYQAFGVGGRFTPTNDGSVSTGALAVAPHYSAMAASLLPAESIAMWDWLIRQGYFSPLNNVESLAFPADSGCDPAKVEVNQLKGSWNLAMQTLGWGRYLAERAKQTPILWQALDSDAFLRRGYSIMARY
jgi:hypothetical protein